MPVTTVVVVGAAGYVGGELLRLLLGHPRVRIVAATSRTAPNAPVHSVHPNLRGVTTLRFSSVHHLPSADVVFLAGGRGDYTDLVGELAMRPNLLIDLSPDFRLRDPVTDEHYYGSRKPPPVDPTRFVPGLPELYRSAIASASWLSVPGCMATAAILALAPLSAAGILEREVTVDARCGSSGSGAAAGPANAHAERSGAMRIYAPNGHRHEAETAQATGLRVHMSATGVEAVRGVQIVCRATARQTLDDVTLWQLYRRRYDAEPFVRIIAQRKGIFRYPEPKILIGSNYCDVGFASETEGRGLVLMAALDNLVKGGAGNAVQCLNIRMGWPETLGLEFPGLHPV